MTDIIKKDGSGMDYSDKIKDHFFNPRNVMKKSEEAQFTKESNAIGMEVSYACGDTMKLWLKIKDNKIVDCRWKTFGCAIAISSTSMFSEMIIGMDIDKALNLKAEDISEELDGLPARKLHCANLVHDTFKKTMKNYKN